MNSRIKFWHYLFKPLAWTMLFVGDLLQSIGAEKRFLYSFKQHRIKTNEQWSRCWQKE